MGTRKQSTVLPSQEQPTRRIRSSGADTKQPFLHTQSSNHGRRSGTILEVQTAVSSFAKDQHKTKKRKEVAIASDPKSLKTSTSKPSKSKISVHNTAERAMSSNARGKNSHGASKNDVDSRKHKELEGRDISLVIPFRL
jgi:hypothetical protein